MHITEEKINNHVVKAAPKWKGTDLRIPRFADGFHDPFSNCYISAKRKVVRVRTYSLSFVGSCQKIQN